MKLIETVRKDGLLVLACDCGWRGFVYPDEDTCPKCGASEAKEPASAEEVEEQPRPRPASRPIHGRRR